MNTTENATNPPMPPRLIEDWRQTLTGPDRDEGWTHDGPFAICPVFDHAGETVIRSYRAWLELRNAEGEIDLAPSLDLWPALEGPWLYLGEHPKTVGAISACRDVAGALQRARCHG